MTNLQTITVDLNPRPEARDNIIFLKRGDKNSREVVVKLRDNGEIYQLPAGIKARYAMCKPDKTQVLEDVPSSGIVGDTVRFTLSEQCMTATGVFPAELWLIEDDQVLKTASFKICVRPTAFSDGLASSSDEYKGIANALAKLDHIWGAYESGELVGDVPPLRDAMTALAGQVSADKNIVETACTDISYKIEDFNSKFDAGVISPDMVEFLDLTQRSENLFDASQPVAVGQVYGETGELTANANYDSTTKCIYAGHVAGHTIYASDSIRTLLEYDNTYQLLAHTMYVNGAVGKQLAADTQYLKISIPTGQAESFVLKADSPVTEYIPYQDVYSFSDDVDITALVSENVSEPVGYGMNVLTPDLSWNAGILTDTGAMNPSYSAYKTAGYIPVKPSQIYTIYHWDESRQACILSGFRAYCFFDAQKEFISGWSQGSNLPYQIQTPADCCYLRISVLAANLPNVFLAEGNYKQNVIPEYQEAQRIAPTFLTPLPVFANTLQGKTILGIGDSITQADGCEAGWIMRTANNLGMVGINKGINGSTIAVKESNPDERAPMVTRYQDMPDADVVVVLGGSNDWYYAWTPIGEFADRTNYTFYGALHNLIQGLMQKYADSLIVFCTPIKRGNTANLTNSNGKTLDEYCDIIKEVCAYYGVAVLDCNRDVQLAPFVPWQNNKYFLVPGGQTESDYTHPNDLGHTKIAAYITGQIKALVP